jgi:hypothetical protein
MTHNIISQAKAQHIIRKETNPACSNSLVVIGSAKTRWIMELVPF